MNQRRVMLIQQGARRNYIYARQLEAEGLLHSLMCDAAWPEGKLSPLAKLASHMMPKLAGPISRRIVKGVDPSRIHASLLPNMASFIKHFVHDERAYALIDDVLAISCRRRGLAGVDVIVNYQGNGGHFLKYARKRGVKVVTDFISIPNYWKVKLEEQSRWPDWEKLIVHKEIVDFSLRRTINVLSLSDLYLCPSQAVVRGLAQLPGFDPAKVRLVPYGLSGVLKRSPKPQTGRVLFAGAVVLAKGIAYLAEAARILKERQSGIEIVAAGAVTNTIRNRRETRHITFLGKLDREAMADEFARADVFCLPSLAEGSATVIFEAMAFAIPVVTTPSSGSVVEDGVEGFIVPERDGEAIANAIERIVRDRPLRAAMSKAAMTTAEKYSDENCGAAFIKVIRDLLRDIDDQRGQA